MIVGCSDLEVWVSPRRTGRKDTGGAPVSQKGGGRMIQRRDGPNSAPRQGLLASQPSTTLTFTSHRHQAAAPLSLILAFSPRDPVAPSRARPPLAYHSDISRGFAAWLGTPRAARYIFQRFLIEEVPWRAPKNYCTVPKQKPPAREVIPPSHRRALDVRHVRMGDDAASP